MEIPSYQLVHPPSTVARGFRQGGSTGSDAHWEEVHRHVAVCVQQEEQSWCPLMITMIIILAMECMYNHIYIYTYTVQTRIYIYIYTFLYDISISFSTNHGNDFTHWKHGGLDTS